MTKVTVLNKGKNNFMIGDVTLVVSKTAEIEKDVAEKMVAKYPDALQIVEAKKADKAEKKGKADKAEVTE